MGGFQIYKSRNFKTNMIFAYQYHAAALLVVSACASFYNVPGSVANDSNQQQSRPHHHKILGALKLVKSGDNIPWLLGLS